MEDAEGKAREAFRTVSISHLIEEEAVFLTYCQFSRNQQVTVWPAPNLGSQVWTPARETWVHFHQSISGSSQGKEVDTHYYSIHLVKYKKAEFSW